MPEPFTSSVMTDKGVELLTKAQAGQCVIEFTRVAIGNGEYEEDEKTPDALKERTELKSEKNSYSITDMEIYNEKCVKVSTLITNCDPETKESIVPEGYYINEIALYAREQGGSEETLYSIAVAEEQGDFIPSYTGANLAQITQTFFVTVNNSAEVTIEDSGVVVTVDRMEREINEMFDKIYPVGSIYMSVNATSPADLFGGAWEQIEDTFLLAAGANHTEGETGGEEAVTLTEKQIPEHSHGAGYYNDHTGGTFMQNGFIADISYGMANGTIATSAVGSGQSHNNMPPYLTVYMWKRTA